MWARSELRARWKAWALLGLLGGATFGLSAAAVAGARRSQDAVPAFVAAAKIPTAAILANDPTFDDAQRAAVGTLAEVRHSYPFLVAFNTVVIRPRGLEQQILPITPRTARAFIGPLVEGRVPRQIDEVVTSVAARRWSSAKRQTAWARSRPNWRPRPRRSISGSACASSGSRNQARATRNGRRRTSSTRGIKR
jgi:hypothetical protein